jgi:hypothetical protein
VNIKLNCNLPCGQNGPVTAEKPTPGGTTSENLPEPMAHHTKEKLESTSPKAVQLGEATSIGTQLSIQTLRRDRDTEKAPVKSINT